MDANGSNQSAIQTTATSEKVEGWSPDGSQVLVTTNATGERELWTLAPDGSSSSQVTDHGADVLSADWR
jgi:Tol biopolymer transport system component